MKNLIKFLQELEQTKLKKSETKKGLIITTTQRNNLKKDFMKALELDIANAIDIAYNEKEILNELVLVGETAEGLLIAPEHRNVPDTIPFKIGVKVGNLDYNASDEIAVFQMEQNEKAEKLAQKERAKKEKIARDTEMYERRRLEKEALEK